MIFLKRSHDASKWTYVRKIQENAFFCKWCVGYPRAPAKEGFLKWLCECFVCFEFFKKSSVHVYIVCFGVSKTQVFKWYLWKGHMTLESAHMSWKFKKIYLFENDTWGLPEPQQKKLLKNDCVNVLSALKFFWKHPFRFTLRVFGSVRPRLSNDMFVRVTGRFKVNIGQENARKCIFWKMVRGVSQTFSKKSFFKMTVWVFWLLWNIFKNIHLCFNCVLWDQ